MATLNTNSNNALRASVFLQQLHKLLPKALQHHNWHKWALCVAWQSKVRKPLACVDDVQTLVFDKPNGARRLLGILSGSVPQTQRAAIQLDPLEVELLVCLTLFAADILVREREICVEGLDAQGLHLGVNSAKAAALVGACWFDRRLHLVRGNGWDDYVALNVVDDLQALELGFTGARDALDAELVALYENAKNPDPLRRMRTLRRLKQDENPSQETIRFYLEELQDESEMQALLCLPQTRKEQISAHVLRGVEEDYGIPSVFYGEGVQSEIKTWKNLQGDLMTLVVENVLKKLFYSEEAPVMKPTIFISYAHEDHEWLARLRVHLKGLENIGLLDFWDDGRIEAGEDWFESIEAAMEKSSIAILLISPHFLASKFITTQEVPSLLAKREKAGMKIIPLLIESGPWRHVEWLRKMQMRPRILPEIKSLAELSREPGRVNAELAKLLDEIVEFLHKKSQ